MGLGPKANQSEARPGLSCKGDGLWLLRQLSWECVGLGLGLVLRGNDREQGDRSNNRASVPGSSDAQHNRIQVSGATPTHPHCVLS